MEKLSTNGSSLFCVSNGESHTAAFGDTRTVMYRNEWREKETNETEERPLSAKKKETVRVRTKLGGWGAQTNESTIKVEHPPALPMEAILESEWPPLANIHR